MLPLKQEWHQMEASSHALLTMIWSYDEYCLFRSCYAASKHALQAFMDCLRAELAQNNIDVTVVSPGYLKTNISKNALTAQKGDVYGSM